MVVLPAALVWAEQRGPLRVPRSRAEVAALARAAGGSLRAGGARPRGRVRGAARRAAQDARVRVRRVVPSRK